MSIDVERYRQMSRCRRFEEAAQAQLDAGNVPGPLHLSIGQEAVAVGVCEGLRVADVITSTHRGHHHCIAKGLNLGRLMAELLGRQDGYSFGRGGSMHVAAPEMGVLGTNGVVGGGIPIAAGAAFGLQVQGCDHVAVAFFGEGAAATGGLAEALNISALWRLPIVFVCENNQYVELTPQALHVAGEIWRRAAGYGMPGVRVDGNDVSAVSAVAAEAVARARCGEGPTLIEALTYRISGHYAGDKAAYRDDAELDEWLAQDPLVRVRTRLPADEVAEIDSEVDAEIQAAVAWALNSPAAVAELLHAEPLKAGMTGASSHD